MDTTIRVQDEVWTADGQMLGVAVALHYRPADNVDLGVALYPTYLEVKSYELGEDFFVPLVAVVGHNPDGDRVLLDVTMKKLLNNTWGRMPDFVAKMEGRVEPLSEVADAAVE